MVGLPTVSYVYLSILGIALIVIGLSLGLGMNLTKWKDLFHEQPLKIKTSSINPKRLKNILKEISELDMQEREVVLASLFGRPIKILKCCSEDGLSWLHSVAPIEVEDTEYPIKEGSKIQYTG